MGTAVRTINPIRHEEMIKQPNVKAGREVMTESGYPLAERKHSVKIQHFRGLIRLRPIEGIKVGKRQKKNA